MELEFRKLPRKGSGEELRSDEWRLASVKEVETDFQKIKSKEILGAWDIVRLLDGWVDGPGYGYRVRTQHRHDMGHIEHMLLVKKDGSRKSDGSFDPQIYYGVKLSRQGKEAALLLSCEDKITEVICFVLYSLYTEFGDRGKRQAKLDHLMESLKKKSPKGRTVMHCAANQSHSKKHAEYVAEMLVQEFENGKELVKAADKYRRTALHFAASRGNTQLCKFLIEKCEMRADGRDQRGENLMHFAVKVKTLEEFKHLCALPGVKEIIDSQDNLGKTALHKAAAKKDGTEMIRVLMSTVERGKEKALISLPNLLGQTALHEAARVGNEEAVRCLLGYGSSPLERDSDGRTALHYAVQLSEQSNEEGSQEKAIAMANSLLNSCKSIEEKSLLLWASAAGIGIAEASAKSSHNVKEYLKNERKLQKRLGVNLLQSAIDLQQHDMAYEFVNRGADLAKIAERSSPHVQDFLNRLERGRKPPTIDDAHGRKRLAEGLAALLLNPYVKTPVSVGILGDWGMGKSSLMDKMESIMLQTVAQLLFPNLIEIEDLPGSIEFKLSREGGKKYGKIQKAVKHLKIEDLKDYDGNPLVYFLDKYQQKYPEVYKALALMDRKEMFHVEKSDLSSNGYSLANIPTILTVRYSAWQYQNEREAWAGLAVEIQKAIEESMTSAQRLRCRWRYAWKENRNKMYLELFLPCFLAIFLSGLVALVLWRVFSRLKDKELVQLKYGSIPITILVSVWTVMKQVNSVFKPISSQIMGYFQLPSHSINLGYQNQVISDVKFSKNEFGEKPSCLWKFIAWLWNFCGLCQDNVKGTSIPKSPPPCEDDIRIIVFVHDLDRCQDTTILKVLSAINLVLTACEINVILGVDKKMIIRAMGKKFGDKKSEEDLAEKYLSKIVQLPLALPDIDDHETEYLKPQLGWDSDEDADSNDGEQELRETNADDTGCHWKLNIHESIKDTCPDFSSKMFKFFEPIIGITNRLFGRKPGLEDKTSKRRVRTPIKMKMLLSNYSHGERHAIVCLSKVAADSENPGEWKRFLKYHRVAWNVLYQSEQVGKCAGWQMQLLVWIFCCWRWRDEIKEIIEHWKMSLSVNDHSKNNDEQYSSGDEEEEKQQLSLRKMVEHYMEVKGKVKTDKDDKRTAKEKNWDALKNTLNQLDVSLECVQAFQKKLKIENLPRPAS